MITPKTNVFPILIHKMAYLFLILIVFNGVSYAQTNGSTTRQLKTITGKVSNEKGEGLSGASIIVPNTNHGVATDQAGNFTIDVQPATSALTVEFVGYASQVIRIGNQSVMNVTLGMQANNLDNVVVVGYGRQSRRTLTTSISKLDTKVLENVPYPNLTAAMQGTLPGVRVQSLSGQPGAALRVTVRGGTSVDNPNGSGPLYLVDGIIRPDINDVASEDIESLQVLKDAAATAIYGARGSNGVVLITTKSGKAGVVRINYSYDVTVSDIGKNLEYLSSKDHIYYTRLGYKTAFNRGQLPLTTFNAKMTGANSIGTGNDLTNKTNYTTQYLTEANKLKLVQGWQSMPDPLDSSKTIIFGETNFEDVMMQTGVSHNHHLSFSGGSSKASFNAGVGYMTADGTVITTKYKRVTFNLNGDLKLRDNISVFGRLLYSNSTSNLLSNGDQAAQNNLFYRAGLPSTAKYSFEDGTLSPGQSLGIGNAEYYFNRRNDGSYANKITLATGGSWTLLPGLSFDPQVSVYRTQDNIRGFQPSYLTGGDVLVTTRTATNRDDITTQYQADAVLTYTKAILTNHHLEGKAGYSYFERNYSNLQATGTGAPTDLIPTLNASANFTGVQTILSKLVLPGYFGRINYDFKQKYLLMVNGRYDGASNLGQSHKWGFFPGAAVGWNLHEENFWKALPVNLITLKLRGSYGVNGNISGLGEYDAQGSYNVPTLLSQQRYAGNIGLQLTGLPNQDLQWERSKTLNVGVDLGLFKNRISLLVDVYRRVTDNLIANLTLPASVGFSSILTNLGSMENKGVEFELSARILPPSSAVSWDFSFNIAKVKNKILHLPPSGTENNRIGGIQIRDPQTKQLVWVPGNGGRMEGYNIGDIYAYKFLGVYATDEAAAQAPVDMIPTVAGRKKYGGDAIWQDTDGNGLIDDKDKVYIGNAFAVWTGGFSNSVGYKGLSVTVRMDYALGHSIYNYARGYANNNLNGDITANKDLVDKSWKKQGDITDVPRYNPVDHLGPMNFWRGNGDLGIASNYVEKGDYLCLREISLGYNLPTALLRKVKMSNLRINVSGSNLYYFTSYTGRNPEEPKIKQNTGY